VRRAKILSLLCLCAALSSARANGQAGTATIRGQVLGQFLGSHSSFPLGGAVVRVLDLKGDSVKAVYTDRNGRFEMSGLFPSAYLVKITKLNFVDGRRSFIARASKSMSLRVILREVPPAQSDCPAKPLVPAFPADMGSLQITFERSTGMGAYTIHISGDGNVKYVGSHNAPHVGPLSYTIPPSDVRRLLDGFYKNGFFSLCKEYWTNWTDTPGTHTSIVIGPTEWVVDDDGEVGPKRLKVLNSLIDKIAGPPQMSRK